MNVSRRIVLNHYSCGFFHKAKGDDNQSVAATLIREEEKNKLSPIERAWMGGTM
jgi:hypothetical protein